MRKVENKTAARHRQIAIPAVCIAAAIRGNDRKL